MSRYDRMKECPACGTPWNTHMGITPTCKKLQVARKALEEICRKTEAGAYQIAVKALEETK